MLVLIGLAKLKGLFLHNINQQIGIHLLKQVVFTIAYEKQDAFLKK